jgi:hypothetical protein
MTRRWAIKKEASMSDQNKPQTNIDPPLTELLLALVPLDGTTIGNTALVTQGLLVKGQGRGGSVRRAAAPESHIVGDLADGADGFALQAEVAPATVAQSPKVSPKPAGAAASSKAAPKQRAVAVDANDAAQIIAYRHADKRVNNPEVGMVTPATDPEAGKNRWAYDPHLDPALQFDPQRGSKRRFVPDFLIRLANGKLLVLEIKGEDSDQNRYKRMALDTWVRAVNSGGGFGTWCWDVVKGEPSKVLDVVLHHACHAMHSEPIGEGVLVAGPNKPSAVDLSSADSDGKSE